MATYKKLITKTTEKSWFSFCNNTTENFGMHYKIAANNHSHPTSLADILDDNDNKQMKLAENILDTLFITNPSVPHTTAQKLNCNDYAAPVQEIGRILQSPLKKCTQQKNISSLVTLTNAKT